MINLILPILKIVDDDIALVGERACRLSKLAKHDLKISDGFVVTVQLWEEFLKETSLDKKIEQILDKVEDLKFDPIGLKNISDQIQLLIRQQAVPKKLSQALFAAYEKLGEGKVLLRPSFLPKKKLSLSHQVYFNLEGEATVLEHIKYLWASAYSAINIKNHIQHPDLKMAILVQKFSPSETNGLLYGLNHKSGKKDSCSVQVVWGLIDFLEKHIEQADEYFVKRSDEEIEKIVNSQVHELGLYHGEVTSLATPISRQHSQKLTQKEIVNLSHVAPKLQKIFFYPQIATWSLSKDEFTFWDTEDFDPSKVLKKSDKEELPTYSQEPALDLPIVGNGIPVSPGLASGKLVFIKNENDLEKLGSDSVAVIDEFSSKYYPIFAKAVGILSKKDGIKSSLAHLAREKGIPTLVGIELQNLDKNLWVTVDGIHGFVYHGHAKHSFITEQRQVTVEKQHSLPTFETKTQLYLNLPSGNIPELYKKELVDGVVCISGEYLLLKQGTHPTFLTQNNKGKVITNSIVKYLKPVLEEMKDKPVFYKLSDLSSQVAKQLEHNKEFETRDTNPVLGFRGMIRHFYQLPAFLAELQAVSQLKADYKNLNLVAPLVRSTSEIENLITILNRRKLKPQENIDLYLSLSTPANLISLPEYRKYPISGFIIDMAELTTLMLGVDPNNTEVEPLYHQLNSSVLWLVKHTLDYANRNGLKVIIASDICGTYPQITEMLVKHGAQGLSVSSDLLHPTKRFIHKAELK